MRTCQAKYTKRLQFLSADSNFEEFRSLCSKLNWIVHTIPDIARSLAQSDHVIKKNLMNYNVKHMNRFVKYLQKTFDPSLLYKPRDKLKFRQRYFSKSSFSHKSDMTSHNSLYYPNIYPEKLPCLSLFQ